MAVDDPPIKFKDLLRELREAGWTPARTKGKHQVWKDASGKTVVFSYKVGDADRSAVKHVRRAIQDSIQLLSESIPTESREEPMEEKPKAYQYLYLPKRVYSTTQEQVIEVLLSNAELWSDKEEDALVLSHVEYSDSEFILYRERKMFGNQVRIDQQRADSIWSKLYLGPSRSSYRGLRPLFRVGNAVAKIFYEDEEIHHKKFKWSLGFSTDDPSTSFFRVEDRILSLEGVQKTLEEMHSKVSLLRPDPLVREGVEYLALYAWPIRRKAPWFYVAKGNDSLSFWEERTGGCSPSLSPPSQPSVYHHGPVRLFARNPTREDGKKLWMLRIRLPGSTYYKEIAQRMIWVDPGRDLSEVALELCQAYKVSPDQPFAGGGRKKQGRALVSSSDSVPVNARATPVPKGTLRSLSGQPILAFEHVNVSATRTDGEGRLYYRAWTKGRKRKSLFCGWAQNQEEFLASAPESWGRFLEVRETRWSRKEVSTAPVSSESPISSVSPSGPLEEPVVEVVETIVPDSEVQVLVDDWSKICVPFSDRMEVLSRRLSTPEVVYLRGAVLPDEVVERAVRSLERFLDPSFVPNGNPLIERVEALVQRFDTHEVRILYGTPTMDLVLERAFARMERELDAL